MVDALRNPMPMSTISTRPLDVAESFEKKKGDGEVFLTIPTRY